MSAKFPDYVDHQQVLKMCGFSKQRLWQLRQAKRFPEPTNRINGGPVWLRADIYQFLDTWSRIPGPRPASLTSSEAVSGPS